jgi:hypothetical protein
MENSEIFCLMETPSQSLPVVCPKRVWLNGANTRRSIHLCGCLPFIAVNSTVKKSAMDYPVAELPGIYKGIVTPEAAGKLKS